MSAICVVGSANVDLIFRSPRFPQPGETLTGRAFQQCMGGKGANQAVAAARLGGSVQFIACVGQDTLGQAAIEQYRAEGIDVEYVRRVAGEPTGTAAIIVDDQAENCIIVVPGANASLSCDDIQQASQAISQASVVVAQLETPLAATLAAFRLARAAKVRTMLTPAPVIELPDELLELCDVIVPNRTEIQSLCGCSVRDTTEAKHAASRLLDRGVKAIALTLGSDGALIVERDTCVHVPAHTVKAVDTTGAGDAFSAALAVFVSEGWTLVESAQRAARAAAISVTRPGTQTSFAYRHEL